MALENLQEAAQTLLGSLHVHVSTGSLGYYLSLVGLGLLLVFAVGFTGLLIVGVARRVADMTPGELLKSLFILAGILLIVGLLVP